MGVGLGGGLNACGRIRRGRRNRGTEKLRAVENGGRVLLHARKKRGGRSCADRWALGRKRKREQRLPCGAAMSVREERESGAHGL